MANHPVPAMEALLTLADVAKVLQVSIPTLRTWESRGQIKFVRLPSGTVRIHPDELRRITSPEEAGE